MNISLLTRGYILPIFEYIIITRSKIRTGGSGLGHLQTDIEKIGVDEIDVIKVYVDWFKHKNKKKDKKIYAEIVEKKIEAELLKKFDKKIKINVELRDN